jgi:lipid-A-disaccharide synthase
MNSVDLFIFAAEPSGDLHGEEILSSLFEQNPELRVEGVGGPKMRPHMHRCILPMEQFQVMGFGDVLLRLPQLIRRFYKVRRAILSSRPRVVLLIDYPGFNLRMARSLRKQGFTGKICHYICPSVWAWKKNRIEQMSATLDLLLTILPFEVPLFSHTSLPVHFVGHPLIPRMAKHSYSFLSLGHPLISLFPGSRKQEIQRNFPLYLRTAHTLLRTHPHLCFAVSMAHRAHLSLLQNIMKRENIDLPLVYPEDTYNLMKASSYAIAKSGTVTLELALHAVPTIVTYALSPLDLWIARDLLKIRLPHYCIVNILLDKRVFPELIGPHFSQKTLTDHALELLKSRSVQQECREMQTQLITLLQKEPKRVDPLYALLDKPLG